MAESITVLQKAHQDTCMAAVAHGRRQREGCTHKVHACSLLTKQPAFGFPGEITRMIRWDTAVQTLTRKNLT